MIRSSAADCGGTAAEQPTWPDEEKLLHVRPPLALLHRLPQERARHHHRHLGPLHDWELEILEPKDYEWVDTSPQHYIVYSNTIVLYYVGSSLPFGEKQPPQNQQQEISSFFLSLFLSFPPTFWAWRQRRTNSASAFTSVPYQDKMSQQLGSGGRPVAGGPLGSLAKLGKAATKGVGKDGKNGVNMIKSTAKKGKGKYDKKLPPGSMKRKVAMVGLGLGAEYSTQKAINSFLNDDKESADDLSKKGFFARHAPSAERRRKIYDGGLSLMESELNRRRGRTDATSEKLERLHHYFDK